MHKENAITYYHNAFCAIPLQICRSKLLPKIKAICHIFRVCYLSRENIVLETRFVQISLELRVLFVILEIDLVYWRGKNASKVIFPLKCYKRSACR